jgi:hypothetical protein
VQVYVVLVGDPMSERGKFTTQFVQMRDASSELVGGGVGVEAAGVVVAALGDVPEHLGVRWFVVCVLVRLGHKAFG